VAHPILWVVVAIAVAVAALSIIPYPNAYNVQVNVTSHELSFVLFNEFGIDSVSGSTTGTSPILDWSTWGLGFGLPAIAATFVMTVCIEQTHCGSKSRGEWFPTVPIVNGAQATALDEFTIGYVPSGCNQPISVTLTQSGSTVASGSGSVNVGGGC
jgi:hypothetical protein